MTAVVAALLLAGCASLPDYAAQAEAANAQACPPRPARAVVPAAPINLALSGGGYRAMLFHVGTLWRLHELGLLRDASHISSVSAGSITSALLALEWNRLDADDDTSPPRDGDTPMRTTCFRALVAEPLVRLAGDTIDLPAILQGIAPMTSPAARLEATYKRALFGDARLADLPTVPQFIFNATNLQTGAAWTFTRELMGDSTLGYTASGRVHLAEAVAASSAFPPYLSPLSFRPRDPQWQPAPQDVPGVRSRASLRRRKGSRVGPGELDRFREVIPLIDGGVADNLGIESVWDFPGALLISDGGGSTEPAAAPATNWLSQMTRVLELVDDQPSELRANIFVELQRLRDRTSDQASRHVAYDRDGAYWDIGELPGVHRQYCNSPVDASLIESLWRVETRLRAMPALERKRLVNWGYHAADYAMPYVRRLMTGMKIHRMSSRLPYPEAGIFVDERLTRCIERGNWNE